METEKTQGNEAEFDAFASDYDSALNEGLKLSGEGKDYFAENRMKWLSFRLRQLNLEPGNALDFGCGTGSATPFFFDILKLKELSGFDPSEKSLEQARTLWSEYSVSFHSDISQAKELELGFCNGVFHHIPPSERTQAAGSVFKALKPGACFAFWENNPWNPVTRYAMSRVPFDADAILVWPHEARKLLRGVGFQILITDYKFFFPRPLAFCRPLEPKLRWLPLGGQYLILAQKPAE